MSAFDFGPVDRNLVHKHKDENVFVRDLRRAVPGVLSREVVETVVLPALSPQDCGLFLRYYLPWVSPEGSRDFALLNIPHMLPQRLIDEEGGTRTFTAAEKSTLLRSYGQVPGKEGYHLTEVVSEMEDVVLAHIFEPKGMGLSVEERILLANLFELIPNLRRDDLFHAGLHVSASHPFFFEHANEHVPGMMVLEAARQFAMACWHKFGKIPLHGYQFILNQLSASFFDYVDLNYPATFKGEVRDLTTRKNGEWETATVHVSVHQGENVCAEVSLPTQVLSKRSFVRMRAMKAKTDPLHRFQPIATIHHKLALWNIETQKYSDARLIDLSLEGLRAELPDGLDENAALASWEAFLYFEDVGFIRVRCALVWQRNDRDRGGQWAGFRFLEVRADDKAHLQTVIRQYCHVRRERSQL